MALKLGDTVTLAPGAFESLSGKGKGKGKVAKVAKAASKPEKTAAKKPPPSPAQSSTAALPSTTQPSSAQEAGNVSTWMPAAGEALVVCSLFHPSSRRGILVSSLTDPTRLWVAADSDLVPVRAVPISHLYRAGDLVQLDAAYEEKLVKCLGAPAEGRTGRVISAGCVRKGVQRNIEVAFVAERAAGDSSDAEDGGDIVVSLYSALELLPVNAWTLSRYSGSCTSIMADEERLKLIEILNELSKATKIPLVGSRLVDKFGDGVFSKLWPVFAGHKDTYVAAVKAFSTWHLRRLSHLQAHLPDTPTQELVAYRESYGRESYGGHCRSTFESAPALGEHMVCAAVDTTGDTAGNRQTWQTWTCDSCCIGNPIGRTSCCVCEAQVPTWRCANPKP